MINVDMFVSLNDEVDERPSAEVTPAPHSAATPPPAATLSAPLPVMLELLSVTIASVTKRYVCSAR